MKQDKTIKQRGGKRSILYIELKSPYPQLLKQLAEKQHRSAKAQAEVIVMTELDRIVTSGQLAARDSASSVM